jgi:hypothetical protein
MNKWKSIDGISVTSLFIEVSGSSLEPKAPLEPKKHTYSISPNNLMKVI